MYPDVRSGSQQHKCHLVFGQDRCGARTPACRVGTRADACFGFGALGVTCRSEAKEHMSFKMSAREKTKRHWALACAIHCLFRSTWPAHFTHRSLCGAVPPGRRPTPTSALLTPDAALPYSLSPPTFSTDKNASCGISTRPTRFIRRLPSFCFSSSLRLRLISPP